MPKRYSGENIAKILIENGYEKYGWKGTHLSFRRSDKKKHIVIPMHKELKPSTLRRIMKQAGLKQEYRQMVG